MTIYRVVAGDNNTPLPATLNGVTNLTGATIRAHLTPVGTGATHDLGVSLVDAAASKVQLSIASTDAVTAGVYFLEWQATFPDTTVLTWPTRGTDVLLVRPQLA